MKDYKKYRWFFTSNGVLVVGGKSSEQNEELVKKAKKTDIILHTKDPGSPFCILSGDVKGKDIGEAAIFCACFSQGWKKRKKKMEIHVFRGSQAVKEKRQKVGTFTVIGKVQRGFVRLELWLGIQKKKLRAAPRSCFKKPLMRILPGKISKEKAAIKIKEILKEKFSLSVSKDEILQAIPAGGFSL